MEEVEHATARVSPARHKQLWRATVSWLIAGVGWLLGAAGKLGPLVIAWLVFSFNSAMAQRSAIVEDQKLRLALFDKRLSVYDSIEKRAKRLLDGEHLLQEELTDLGQIVRKAEMLFPDELHSKFSSISKIIRRLVRRLKDIERFEVSGDADERFKALDEALQADSELLDALREVRPLVIAAMRVQETPPLAQAPLLRLRTRLRM